MPLPILALLQEAAAPASAPAPTASPLSGPLIPLLLAAILFVFMLVVPERKKQKQRQKMLDALKKGDRVMTSSGLYGTVVSTTNEIVVLQVAEDVRLRFSRSAIQNVLEGASEAAVEEKAEPSKA